MTTYSYDHLESTEDQPLQKETPHRIETTADEEVAMGFQQFKFNTLSPFLYRNPGKKNPPLS